MAAPVRVLLVEDDASLQRFVAMALEDQDVRLVGCTSVNEALQTLARHAFDLIITDLMLPAQHGDALLATLRDQPSLRGSAALAVFSAGLNAQVREKLTLLGVKRFLVKPCALADLHACVDEARAEMLKASVSSDVITVVSTTPGGIAADATEFTTAGEASWHAQQAVAIETFFGGNAPLYQAFLNRCRHQFPKDLAQGREAAEHADVQALRLLAHSLKSVLTTLGQSDAAALARALEDLAHDAQQASANDATSRHQALRDSWQCLEAAMASLLRSSGSEASVR